tara:strand:- start:1531 stop:2751 length:1221 start_codon:yes stop_codon:yes gene_type:complete
MSNSESFFRFQRNSDSAVNINFTEKYKGWLSIIYCKSIIKIVLNRLDILKKNNNYKKLNKELKYLHNRNTVFLTPYDCEFVINTFSKLTIIRHFLNKHVYSTLKKRKNKEINIINNQDLQFNDIHNYDKNIIKLENNSKIYQFRISEILAIYKFAVYNINSDYIIPEPITPKNPYTNEELTLRQQYIIYDKILDYYCKKGRSLPEHYILMKNSYFSTDKFKKKYYCYLIYKCAVTETNNLSEDDWFMNIDNYLGEYDHYCRICFKRTKNVRKIFSGILELFVLNEHDIFSYGDAISEYMKIAKNHNLIFDDKHEIMHRRVVRARRRATWRNNQTITNTSVNLDTENITGDTAVNTTVNTTVNTNEDVDSTTSRDSSQESPTTFSGYLGILESESLGLLPSEDNSEI